MRTVEEMLDFVYNHKLTNIAEKRKTYEKHFALVQSALKPDEDALFAFTAAGVSNSGQSVASGYTAVIFTPSRCIYGQKSLLTANPVKIILYDNISDIQKNTHLMSGSITLDFLTEVVKFSVGKQNLDTIFNEIMKILEEYKKAKAAQHSPTAVVQQPSAADELKKFKELLDSGVITQEEFDAKKKQLLGL